MQIELSQIFTQIVSFLFMLWVLTRYAWKPLLKVMEDRQKKIQTEFDNIGAQKIAAEKLLEEYQEKHKNIDAEGRARIKEAVAKGQQLFQELESEAHVEAQGIIHKAKAELKTEVIKARLQLKDELVNLTLMATQNIIKTNLDTEKQKKIINDFIEQAEIS